jgi:hypothetical protein
VSAIERVMQAYTRKYHLSPEQAALVHAELCRFIGELTSGGRPEETTSAETKTGRMCRDPWRGETTENSPIMPEIIGEHVVCDVSVATPKV